MADINGSAASESLPGTIFGDTIDFSQGGNDTVTAGNGDDTLLAGAALTAADRLDGGANYDTLFLDGDYSAGLTLGSTTITNIEEISFVSGHSYRLTSVNGNVAASGVLAVNALNLQSSATTLYWDGSAETDGSFVFNDGIGADTLIGGQQADQFFLSGGSDVADGRAGNDEFTYFGSGFSLAASLNGGADFDTLKLNGAYAADIVLGGQIQNIERIELLGSFDYKVKTLDSLLTAGQSIRINGSFAAASDLVFYGAAETSGSFEIQAGPGNDTLTGGQGNDSIYADLGGNDRILGAGGDDLVLFYDTFTGADFVNGGTGNDVVGFEMDLSAGLSLGAANFVSVERFNIFGAFDQTITALDSLTAGGVTTEINSQNLGAAFSLNFNGSAETNGAFRVIGGFGADSMLGGAGADRLDGGYGNDTLSGGGGVDTLVGGFGSDLFFYTAGDVLEDDPLDTGVIDTVITAVTISLSGLGIQSIENITLTGTANANMTGNGLGNVLIGNSGNNILNGFGNTGIPADTMIGGAGNDIYYVYNTGDVTTELAGGGVDLVSSSVSRTLGANIENLNLSGVSNINGSGNTLANIINGNAFNNYLRGFEGADTLNGGTGSDTLQGGTASDRLNPGSDTTEDFIRFSAVADSTGSLRDIVTGMDLNNEDRFDFPAIPTSLAFVNTGTLNLATINANLATAVDAALAANGAVLFDPTAGDLDVSGHSFLVVDANGDGVYRPNQDYVVQLVNFTGTLTLDDFF
jgi:Ca2+-binding RTX toxin-like protein